MPLEDDLLKTEAIYYSAPIPRGAAVLTVLGTVFDKVYFPGVHLPKDGFDEVELDKEISRLEALEGTSRGDDRKILIAILRFLKLGKTLEGFCEFTGSPNDAFGGAHDVSNSLVEDLYYSLHGPRRPNWQPHFDTGHYKELPGGNAFVAYPGTWHYFAKAVVESSKTGIPIINDLPGLPIPGLEQSAPVDDAKALATLLAIECTSIILPTMPLLHPKDLMEFRAENKGTLRAFRRAMLRYSADLNEKISGLSYAEFENKTKFFIDTEIVPALDELRAATWTGGKQSWTKRAMNGIQVIPEIAAAYFTMGREAAIAKALTTYAAQFFTEISGKGERREALKRSGLYYLMRLQAHAEKAKR